MSDAEGMAPLFERRHFDREVVMLCVRWYLRSGHSLRRLVEMMSERGLSVAHTTLMRWTRRCGRAFRNGDAALTSLPDRP